MTNPLTAESEERRESFRDLLKKRLPWLVWALIVFFVTEALMRFPLLDVVSYEFSFIMSGLLSAAGIHIGVRSAREKMEIDRGFFRGPEWVCRSKWLGRKYWFALQSVGLLWFLALNGAMAHAAVAHDCSTFQGVAFYLLLPGVSVVVSTAVGVFWGVLLPVKVWPVVGGLATIFASVLFGFYKFYFRPPVSIYDPFFGYFSGNFYDELLFLDFSLIAARVLHVTAAFSLLVTAIIFLDCKKERLSLTAGRRPGWLGVIAVLFWTASALLYSNRGALGFSLDEKHMARRLGGRVDTRNYRIFYDAERIREQDALLLAKDAEFRHHQLKNYLGEAPESKITIYLFGSYRQKKRLFGAHQVEMAKPWRREIYITAAGFPHPVLKHELAHVFASSFGDSVFGLAVRWIRLGGLLPWPAFSPGLIEGVAVAADWTGNGLTPHQSVRAMIELGLDPPLEEVMGLAFFSTAAVRSYAVAGSFCRYLIDQHGSRKFRQLFRSGGDYERVYGQSLESLGDSWKRFVEKVPLSEEEKAVAEKRMSVRSVFQRVCVRKTAALRHKAAGLAPREALRVQEEICRIDPFDVSNFFMKMLYEIRVEKFDAAWETAGVILGRKDTPKVLRALTYRALGNMEWKRGDLTRAARLFNLALNFPAGDSTGRDLTVRAHAVKNPRYETALRGVLLEGNILGFLDLKRGIEAEPGWALGHYLMGSVELNARNYDGASFHLQRSLELDLPDERFFLEARRRLGRAFFMAERYREAEEAFLFLYDHENRESVRLWARDWMERCKWAADRVSAPDKY